jgi:LysM repeat protein
MEFMRVTAFIATVLTFALLGTSSIPAYAAELPNTKPSAFIDKVLLAYTDTSTNNARSNTNSTNSKPAEPTEVVAEPAQPPQVIITVARGDSLTKIAAANNTTWVRIYDANDSIADPNVINPGQQLRIPAAEEKLTDRALPQLPVVVQSAKVVIVARRTIVKAAPQTNYPVSDDAAKAFIYAHESGNNPNATSPNGCHGLGQDCNGVLGKMCGADYACQDAYFTRYAIARYGSWAGALAFWQSHHWW